MTAGTERFTFIDALRGIASLSVVLFHVSGHVVFRTPGGEALLGPLAQVLKQGYLGVFIFFAISGFVITHSLRSSTITPRFLAKFIARRSIRLDPPLWATLAVALGLAYVTARWVHSPFEPPPVTTIIANVLYAQNLLRLDNLSVGLWTLCLEIQFYLFLVATFGLLNRFRWHPVLVVILLWAPIAVGVLSYEAIDGSAPGLLFNSYRFLLPNLGLFGCGIVAWLWSQGRLSNRAVVPFTLVIVGRLVWRWSPEIAVAAVTAFSFAFAARRMLLGVWLAGAPFQYFGRISYSLYLIHFPVTQLVTRLARHIVGESPAATLLTFVAALVGAVCAADAMQRVLEGPCMRLARKITLEGAPSATPQTTTAMTSS